MKTAVIEPLYFPPINSFFQCNEYENIYIKSDDRFIKQTERNHCRILSSNGILKLTVPLEAGKTKLLLKEVKISNHVAWQKQHFKSIKSAYSSSPFYEYYIYEFEKIFSKHYTFLIDLNTDIFHILKQIYFPKKIIVGHKLLNTDEEIQHSKFSIQNYTQVFADKFQFAENLSVLDYLFNCGNELPFCHLP